MTISAPTDQARRRAQYGASFPAISTSDQWSDRVVTQGHADYCRDFGHATWTIDGNPQGICPRCGDAVELPSSPVCPIHGAGCEAWA